jgi:hypothetical protein
MSVNTVPNGALTHIPRISVTIPTLWRENAVSDLIYLLAGAGVVLIFAGYAALLRRA